MELNDVLRILHVEEAAEAVAPHWEESEDCFPEPGPRFLDPEHIIAEREYALFPASMDQTLLAAARRARALPALAHLAWHFSRVVFDHLEYPAEALRRWPDLEATLGPLSGTFYLLVALDAVPRTRVVHQRLGIPERYTRACFHQIVESTRYYAMTQKDRLGVRPGTLYWLRNHVKGDLYLLGRFDYMLKPFHCPLQAWRHRDGRVLALAEEGTRFDREGLMVDVEESGWEAHLREDEDQITGTPISPLGYALRRRITLPRSQWRRVLRPGDTIIETHIPAGGGMTLSRCRESMEEAVAFFPRYFPDRRFAAFACGSWILNPELEQIYRPDSNMVKWQRELYLFPIPSGRRSGLYFVFGEDDPDPRTAPRDTSLRRALLDHLARGGRLIGGGMFFLTEDLPRFGSQVYRTDRPSDQTRGERWAP